MRQNKNNQPVWNARIKKDTSLNILYPNFTEGLYNEMLERSIYHSKRDRSQQKFALGKDTNEPMHISNMSPSGSLLNGAIANTTDTTVTVDNGAHFSAGQILCVSNATASENLPSLNPGTTYSIKVAAKNGQNASYSSYTGAATATTSSPIIPILFG